jgi:DNA topoisomerase-3
MEVAERLYNKGFLSYPRTETNTFKNMDINEVMKELGTNKTAGQWGSFARKLISDRNLFERPRNGKSDDGAHPPIYPTKHAPANRLDRQESRLYELVCRHFLACCSVDAKVAGTRATL